MRRFLYILTAVLFIGAAVLVFKHYVIDWPFMQPLPSFWLMLVLPMVLLLIGLGVLIYGIAAQNIYHIRAGTVISQHFAPAHWVPQQMLPVTTIVNNAPITTFTYIPGHQEPDTWSLQLEDDKGHTGWLHFVSNVFDRYPVGSHYSSSN